MWSLQIVMMIIQILLSINSEISRRGKNLYYYCHRLESNTVQCSKNDGIVEKYVDDWEYSFAVSNFLLPTPAVEIQKTEGTRKTLAHHLFNSTYINQGSLNFIHIRDMSIVRGISRVWDIARNVSGFNAHQVNTTVNLNISVGNTSRDISYLFDISQETEYDDGKSETAGVNHALPFT